MSNPTTRGKYKLLQLGEGLNSWGLSSGLNGGVFERLDEAVHGVQEITLTSTSYTLTTTNYVENDIRYRILSFSGNFAATIAIPASTENWWIIKNSSGQILTFSNGSNSATIGVGFYGLVHTNGTTVDSLTLPDGVSAKTVADHIASVNQVATDSASVVAVAGKSTEVGRLGTTAAVADLAALGGTSEVANLATLAPRAADIGTLAPRAADLQALAPREADLNTLSPRAADIGTLAPRASDLQALAPREADLNTLSPRASDLQTLSPRAADIGTLADVQDGTTATNALSLLAPRSSDLQALSPRASDLQTLSPRASDLQALAPREADLNTLSPRASDLQTLSPRASDLQALAPRASDLQDLAPRASDLQALAPREADLNTLSPRASDLQALGPRASDLQSLAPRASDIQTLAPISGDITTTAGVSTAVTAYSKQYSAGSGDISTRADGQGTVAEGDLRFRTDTDTMRVYNGTAWEDAAPGAGNYYTKSASDTLLAAKAPLASPTFTGTLAAPTINASTALQIAGTALTATATQLNYVTGVTSALQTQLDAKAPLASPNFSGSPQIGGSNIITAATIPAGGNTVSLTASSSIADGRSVFIKNDGTVAQIIGGAAGSTGGTVYDGGAVSFNAGCFHAAENVSVIAFRDGTDGGKGKIIAFSVNSSTNALTFGTEVTFESNPINGVDICYDSASELVHICYLDTGNHYTTIRSYSLSGTTPTAATSSLAVNGTSVSFNARITYDVTNDAILVVWKDASANNAGKAKAFDYSSGSYTTGGTLTWSGSFVADLQTAYDTNAGKHLCISKNSNNYSQALTLTVSGSGASPTVTSTGFSSVTQTNVTPVALQYHPASGKMMYIWRNNSDNKGQVQLGTYGGSNYTTWTAISDDYIISTQAGKTGQFFNENQARYAYDSDKQIIVVTYYGASNEGSYSVGVGVNGSAITLTEKIEIWNPSDPKSGTYFNSIYDTFRNVAVAHFVSPSTEGQDGYAIIVRFASTDYTKYIGFASGAVSSGAAATIQTTGNVDDAQSGLAIGTSYFVQANGNLATSADVISVPAGKALAATKILIA